MAVEDASATEDRAKSIDGTSGPDGVQSPDGAKAPDGVQCPDRVQSADGAPSIDRATTEDAPMEFLPRKTLTLLPPSTTDRPMTDSQLPTSPSLLRTVSTPVESNLLERLCLLKTALHRLTGQNFWATLTTGLTDLTGAQYAFVSKRLLPGDPTRVVEMPTVGSHGSCYQAVAFHTAPLDGPRNRIVQYAAHSCPSATMRQDRTLIIPHSLSGIYPHEANPNRSKLMAGPGEAYLATPLWWDGACVGHFGVMWTSSGLRQSHVAALGWPLVEACLHGVEDLVQTRLVQHGFGREEVLAEELKRRSLTQSSTGLCVAPDPEAAPEDAAPTSAPDDDEAPADLPSPALFAGLMDGTPESQSLKPYARSLSHELRTPMQGVVGMLDMMYATVQEAAEGLASTGTETEMRQLFDRLKADIETVMDSSRRAVEAADNVVHAYDLNMGYPDTPDGMYHPGQNQHADYLHAGFSMAYARSDLRAVLMRATDRHRGLKRRFDSLGHPTLGSPVPAAKMPATVVSRSSRSRDGTPPSPPTGDDRPASSDEDCDRVAPSKWTWSPRETAIRPLLQFVVNDALRVGGRPQSAIAKRTGNGEIIEVRTMAPSGEERVKCLEWTVDEDVPDTVAGDERDLSKLIGNVVLNAVKFTSAGRIWIRCTASAASASDLEDSGCATVSRYLLVTVADTGPGIPPAFLPQLFKAFAREDDGLTRQSEGLGLGLLVAKGIARRLGGDISCTRADTDGPTRGSEFEIRIPLSHGPRSVDAAGPDSRPSSRCASPVPVSVEAQSSASPEVTPPPLEPTAPATPQELPTRPHGLHVGGPSFGMSAPSLTNPSFATKHPLTFLVVEDNRINRKLLVSMLKRLGYPDRAIYEAYDGADAVRVWSANRRRRETGTGDQGIDVILMDLWMPFMDGYEATERILGTRPVSDTHGSNEEHAEKDPHAERPPTSMDPAPTILAVTADVTEGAIDRALRSGMKGFMMKPYRLVDLERLIVGHCVVDH